LLLINGKKARKHEFKHIEVWTFNTRLSIFRAEIYTAKAAMALSLKDKETDRLARAVAALTGETLTDAVRQALAERLERERLRRGQPGDLAARLVALGREFDALPDFDSRTPDEIVGYDENGMWT